MNGTALIVGAGAGISAAFARLMAAQGWRVALASRSGAQRTAALDDAAGAALRIAGDATRPDDVARMFAQLDAAAPPLGVLLYNAGYRARGALVDLAPDEVQRALQANAFGAFLVAQQAARRLLANGGGSLLFTGASASVKGYPQSAPFAMGKFALRGLVQSIARELAPQGVHAAHVIVDGIVRGAGHPAGAPDSQLEPDAIAQAMWQLVQQPRSAWSWEIELRPFVEKF